MVSTCLLVAAAVGFLATRWAALNMLEAVR